MRANYVFTSESVTAGHPDKLCDQISDAIVDQFLTRDPYSGVVCECAVSTGVLFIATRYASTAKVDITETAREVIARVGYEQGEFNAKDCTIMTSIMDRTEQDYSPLDMAELGDDEIERITAKNQVTVFGYACDQTPTLMPLPIYLAHALARRLAAVATGPQLPYLLPDGKTQIGVQFHDRKPHRIHSITLVAAQREAATPSLEQLREDLIDSVITPVFADQKIRPDAKTQIFVNPEGALVGGGPGVHSGLTGRKNAIDTYGEYSRHSGAALSGKGPLRIDRIGAYAARHAAKNVVAAGLARHCEVQLSYSIGQAKPVSVLVETFGTGEIDDTEIARLIANEFDFRVGGIVREFDLQHLPEMNGGSFYRQLAVYGHMGRIDLDVPWENTDKARSLKR